ncbi:MAG: hypothetical protein JWM27_325 [Gemmatimonadetes bacterium]|nr:hypothetical protein [Gemmatimonadota bacterium]
MTARLIAVLAVAAVLAAAPRIVQQDPPGPPIRESRPGLAARAPVRPAAARRLALARYPGARIVTEVLRERGRRLMYVFGLRLEGSPRALEVLVDAATGRVIGIPLEPEPAHRSAF